MANKENRIGNSIPISASLSPCANLPWQADPGGKFGAWRAETKEFLFWVARHADGRVTWQMFDHYRNLERRGWVGFGVCGTAEEALAAAEAALPDIRAALMAGRREGLENACKKAFAEYQVQSESQT